MKCIECNREIIKQFFKCEECNNPMCEICQKKLWKGWIEAFNFKTEDFRHIENINICCSKCFTLSIITDPNTTVRHPDSKDRFDQLLRESLREEREN